jgi:hypothetical protein
VVIAHNAPSPAPANPPNPYLQAVMVGVDRLTEMSGAPDLSELDLG